MKKPIQFGKYWLLDRVNVGGMAEVWKAKAFGVEGFERLLAVKRILPNIAEDEEFITMFIDEAKIAVQLSHANICQIFDLGKVEDSYFIALEFVHGKDVRALYDRCKQKPELSDGAPNMPLAQACFIIMKACEGLDYAHNKRDSNGRELHLVHRDVSPQNILISYEGEVKLIDFGIAKAAGKASKTQQGILKGKFGYMSPEQVRGLPLDRRSDVFALGIVLYELLTGERLFVGESDFSTLEKVRNVEILPPSTYNRRIGEELERIVMKALAKDVDDRYPNAIDLHDDLQAYMYSAGEFYSRKDLASWMKRMWAPEIEEESQKLEQYRQMPVPAVAGAVQQPMPGVAAEPRARRNSGSLAVVPPPPPVPLRPSQQHAVVPPPPPRPSRSRAAVAPSLARSENGHAQKADLAWDEEELATNIYSGPADDAADAIVEDKPDLSRIELNSDGSPVPHRSMNDHLPQTMPLVPSMLPPPALPAERRRRNPFDGTEAPPRSAGGPAERMTPTSLPVLPVLPMTRPARPLGLFVVGGVALAAACVIAAGVVVYRNGRPGQLFITSEPASNVQILIDNKREQLDGTPATLKLEPGSYVLTVQREGYVPWNEQVEVRPGETTKKRITLEPLASGTGFTLVSEPAGADAFLDGRKLEGMTPLKVQSVMPGRHTIEVRSPTGQWTKEVTIEAGKLLDVRCQLGSAPKTPLQKAVAVRKPVDAPIAHAPPAPAPEKPAVVERAPARRRPTAAAALSSDEDPVVPKKTAPAPVAEKPALPPRPAAEKPAAPAKPAVASEGTSTGTSTSTGTTTSMSTGTSAPAPKPIVPEGFLSLGSKPWTNIAVDGKETGMHTPQTHLKLAAGTHRVTLSNPQFNVKETFSVEIKAGETEKVIKDLRPQAQDAD